MALVLLALAMPPLSFACGVVDQSDGGTCLVERFDGGFSEVRLNAPEGAVVCAGARPDAWLRRPMHRLRPTARPQNRMRPRTALPHHTTLEELSR